MKSSECSGGSQPAGFAMRDGRLWFATIQGAVVIDPDRLRTNVLPPPLVIENVIVDSSPPPRAPAGTVVEVPPGSGELEFHYAALSFRS
jgi:hypothetical protein